MKIHELNNGDTFSAEICNPLTNEIELTITGEFIKMDGAYARVKVWGNDDFQHDLKKYICNQQKKLGKSTIIFNAQLIEINKEHFDFLRGNQS